MSNNHRQCHYPETPQIMQSVAFCVLVWGAVEGSSSHRNSESDCLLTPSMHTMCFTNVLQDEARFCPIGKLIKHITFGLEVLKNLIHNGMLK